MRLSLKSSEDLIGGLGARIKAWRLERNMTQAMLAERSGTSLPSLKRLENTGKGSVDLLARIALTLGAEDGIEALFAARVPARLDEVIAPARRRRASPRPTSARKT